MAITVDIQGQPPIKIAVIIGSVREGRSGGAIADWFIGRAAQRPDINLDVIDLLKISLPLTLPDKRRATPEVARLLQNVSPRLAAADGFVVVTPEYNHSFPASLKNLIDWHNEEWHAKPIAFVSYGGRSGGLRAVEQLRAVFAELHAATIRATVSFHKPWDSFDADGSPVDPTLCSGAVKSMLDQLLWWADALRYARAIRPYSTGPQTD
ncbi:NADPH-dependent FMN reductase [Kribbella deserti]|uniref:NADPH-dependent FMN reductase n=1 Tax=Kribbella deserti TaxID=1926257 RepID=A0ABV6QXL5_9ACTN